MRAEKDGNDDGSADIWFYYENGRATRVEEDTNKDGNVDVWEFYDASEALVRKEEDYDYDGVADVIKDLREKDTAGEEQEAASPPNNTQDNAVIQETNTMQYQYNSEDNG